MPCGLLAVLRRQMPLDQRPHVGARRERRDAVDREWTGQRSGISGRNQKIGSRCHKKNPKRMNAWGAQSLPRYVQALETGRQGCRGMGLPPSLALRPIQLSKQKQRCIAAQGITRSFLWRFREV
jgi:hypothetical protein